MIDLTHDLGRLQNKFDELEKKYKELDQYVKEQHEELTGFMKETLNVLKIHQEALKFIGGIEN